ncbi:MAG TPA: 3-dehydro-L-gulonate 2-dehydrogenase [Bacteroidales bacterium]|nr:3-dehydro-L-gulonate 2-dehydrogenase [Bacteroidales bacterium]
MTADNKIKRIPENEMRSIFQQILIKHGMRHGKAEKCAGIFTLNSLEGVYSHGVNRFPRFVKYIDEGYINPDAAPTLIHRAGTIEQWQGNLGPGPLNAEFAAERAMELAKENGIGLVTLANTNHWMRGGTYGWQAARKGYVFIGWANTCVNMPAWGGKDARIGNNPFVIAVPHDPEAVVLDFAMTQFSYGKMEAFSSDGQRLPFPGGFNTKGELTDDPSEILETMRPVPIGYWKGAGLSILLDILAATLSGGLSTHQIGNCEKETSISQVFIAIDIRNLHNFPSIQNTINEILDDLGKSEPAGDGSQVRYPGENVIKTRKSNLENGIPVDRGLWDKILSL